MRIRQDINEIPCYKSEKKNMKIILNANESGFDVPDAVRKSFVEKSTNIAFNRYPELDAEGMKCALARHYSLEMEQVQVGNGSSELIGAVCKLFANEKILYPTPSFSMYKIYAQLAGAKSVTYQLRADFSVDVDALIDVIGTEDPALVIVCNPNNPTGNFMNMRDLERVLSATKCPVLLDEAYCEFAPENALILLEKYPQMIILRTFSKAFALAQLRFGYLLAAQEISALVGKMLMPYHVNGLTLLAAQAVLENISSYDAQLAQIKNCRQAISGSLESAGFVVVPSSANFVFFYHADRLLMQELAEMLAKNSIAVRNYTDCADLSYGIRLTVGKPQENRLVMEHIGKFLVSRRKKINRSMV